MVEIGPVCRDYVTDSGIGVECGHNMESSPFNVEHQAALIGLISGIDFDYFAVYQCKPDLFPGDSPFHHSLKGMPAPLKLACCHGRAQQGKVDLLIHILSSNSYLSQH